MLTGNKLGTVMPSEYKWRQQAARDLPRSAAFISIDSGKVYGLALALDEALEAMKLSIYRNCHSADVACEHMVLAEALDRLEPGWDARITSRPWRGGDS